MNCWRMERGQACVERMDFGVKPSSHRVAESKFEGNVLTHHSSKPLLNLLRKTFLLVHTSPVYAILEQELLFISNAARKHSVWEARPQKYVPTTLFGSLRCFSRRFERILATINSVLCYKRKENNLITQTSE
jgi:hypothetical protein